MKKNYINALSEVAEEGEYSKINIHFPIRGELNQFCSNLNSLVQHITPTEIDLSPSSFQIPHLTLYMGFIKTKNDFDKVMKLLSEYAKKMNKITITPKKAYLKSPQNRWIFIDIEESEQVKQIKRKIKELIQDCVIDLEWDVVEEPPHITIAYIQNELNEVNAMLELHSIAPATEINSIEVSFVGKRGSCLGSIKSFDFIN